MSYEKSLQGFSNAMDKVIKEVAPPRFLGRNKCPYCKEYLADDEHLILRKDWAYDDIPNPDTGKVEEVMCSVCYQNWTDEENSKHIEPENAIDDW